MEGRNGRFKLLLFSPDLSGQIRTEVDFLVSEPQFQSETASSIYRRMDATSISGRRHRATITHGQRVTALATQLRL